MHALDVKLCSLLRERVAESLQVISMQHSICARVRVSVHVALALP
jgi:hypothetical protein